ncbi:unnamed protein product (mitochondrion) [Plasmodiophora brassicae]|uniref:Uncharacterized protein n=1 Tax=Plasmodiophora brassicae TaxID=37360 RepID=A0A0G4IQB9_PLABS|nr:hypothetical protein PBRA_000750 [Plasmodiophora brassicae]SPQ97716.1 unnamed protein product [Plasmodiophora brassicae]
MFEQIPILHEDMGPRDGSGWRPCLTSKRAAAIGVGILFVSVIVLAVVLSERTRSVDATVFLPPSLVRKPELMGLHYCGLNPAKPSTYPGVPQLLDDQDFELVLVQAFIRHGDRFFDTGDKCWPGQENISYSCSLTHLSMPGINESLVSMPAPGQIYRVQYMKNRNDFEGNCRVGQLTLKGHDMEFTLGTIFKSAYVGRLLNPDLNLDEVYFRSDDVPRTVLSAESVISGMFPENGRAPGSTRIVPIWSMDFDRETEISNAHCCPGLLQQFQQAQASRPYQEHLRTVSAPLREKLSRVFGVPISQVSDNAFDCLMVSLCRGELVPELVDADLVKELEAEARYRFYYPIQFPDRVNGGKLAFGPLLREILARMERAVKGVSTSDPKFTLYSGHDTGPIMLLLSAFGVDTIDPYWAPYSSYISLELYRSKSSIGPQHLVRMVYNGKALPLPLTSLNGNAVSYDDLAAMVQPMIPSHDECPDPYFHT